MHHAELTFIVLQECSKLLKQLYWIHLILGLVHCRKYELGFSAQRDGTLVIYRIVTDISKHTHTLRPCPHVYCYFWQQYFGSLKTELLKPPTVSLFLCGQEKKKLAVWICICALLFTYVMSELALYLLWLLIWNVLVFLISFLYALILHMHADTPESTTQTIQTVL